MYKCAFQKDIMEQSIGVTWSQIYFVEHDRLTKHGIQNRIDPYHAGRIG